VDTVEVAAVIHTGDPDLEAWASVREAMTHMEDLALADKVVERQEVTVEAMITMEDLGVKVVAWEVVWEGEDRVEGKEVETMEAMIHMADPEARRAAKDKMMTPTAPEEEREAALPEASTGALPEVSMEALPEVSMEALPEVSTEEADGQVTSDCTIKLLCNRGLSRVL
jgi:hypothetical protein